MSKSKPHDYWPTVEAVIRDLRTASDLEDAAKRAKPRFRELIAERNQVMGEVADRLLEPLPCFLASGRTEFTPDLEELYWRQVACLGVCRP